MRPCRILLVDDDPAIAGALQALFAASLGASVVTAHDCDSAMEKLSNGWGRPDLIILDLCLPSMDGFELARRMDGDGFDNVPVLFLSGRDAQLEVREAASRTCRDFRFLSKNATPPQILAEVQVLLNEKLGEGSQTFELQNVFSPGVKKEVGR